MKKAILLGAAALLASSLAAQSATLNMFSDDFDSATVHDGAYDNWSGSIPADPQECTEGGLLSCIMFDAGDTMTSISNFNFWAGNTYTITAVFARATGTEMLNFLTYIYSSFGNVVSDAGTVTITFTADQDTTSPIIISANGGDDPDGLGAYLDSISVDQVLADDVPTVPVPSSVALMAAGLGALGLMRRRKARA